MKIETLKYPLYLLACISLLAGCASNPPAQKGKEDAQLLPKDEAKDYAVYAMMSSNVYLKEGRTRFPIEELGWVKVDLDGEPIDSTKNSYTPIWIGKWFSSLQFDIWEHNSTNKSVIAFKGSDEKVDWIGANFWIGPSIQYKSGKKKVAQYIKNNEKKGVERDVIVTGHSLGGGLALSSSLWLGVDAYAFNGSPRVFDGKNNVKKPATRKAIYQEGEVLSKLTSFWPKYRKVMNPEDIYQTNFDYNGVNSHRIDFLAEGLLRCASNDAELQEMASSLVPKKVECSL